MSRNLLIYLMSFVKNIERVSAERETTIGELGGLDAACLDASVDPVLPQEIGRVSACTPGLLKEGRLTMANNQTRETRKSGLLFTEEKDDLGVAYVYAEREADQYTQDDLERVVETRKWGNGEPLTETEIQLCDYMYDIVVGNGFYR